MYNHEPQNYICPFCELVAHKDTSDGETLQEHIFYRDEHVLAFINSHQWPKNPGNALVIPLTHVENIYDISDEQHAQVYAVAKKIAIAMKEVYKCDGTSLRQHNEPAGYQGVWHFHTHVFARYQGDDLYSSHAGKHMADPVERAKFAEKLRNYFETKGINQTEKP